MGNKASLYIKLDHGNDLPIFAGKRLKGRVILTVPRKINGSELIVRLIGTESTIVSKRKGTKREERTIARAIHKLKDFGGSRQKIVRGVYTHSFEFILPASLPSSTQFPRLEGKSFHGRINYVLRAEFGDLRYDRTFCIVSAPLANSIVPCIAQPTTHELKQAMILNKGFLSVGACVENSSVGRGQTLKVSVACRNDSTVDVDHVRIKVVELIEFQAQDEKKTLKNDLVDIRDIDLPGLVKFRSKDNARKRRFSQAMSSTYQQILHDLTSAQNQVRITIPKNARDTYDGNLISISHYLKITYYTKLAARNPVTKIPIIVGSPRDDPRHEGLERTANQPIATIVGDESGYFNTPNTRDESTVEVGYDLPPMVEARILPPQEQSPHTVFPIDGNVAIGSARMLLYSSDDEDCNHSHSVLRLSMPAPSAPDESLLMQGLTSSPPRMIHGSRQLSSTQDGLYQSNPTPAPCGLYHSPGRSRSDSLTEVSVAGSTTSYSYLQEPLRSRIDTYSYGETTAACSLTEGPQLGHGLSIDPPQRTQSTESSQQLFDRLLRELRASFHDYDVIARKVCHPEYRELFSTVSPKQLGQIIANVSMTYQVQVAVLLARHLVMFKSSFTCAHCAEAVNKTSDYFRTNMVETLLPYCHDLGSNRNLIKLELSDWERCVTQRLFEDLA